MHRRRCLWPLTASTFDGQLAPACPGCLLLLCFARRVYEVRDPLPMATFLSRSEAHTWAMDVFLLDRSRAHLQVPVLHVKTGTCSEDVISHRSHHLHMTVDQDHSFNVKANILGQHVKCPGLTGTRQDVNFSLPRNLHRSAVQWRKVGRRRICAPSGSRCRGLQAQKGFSSFTCMFNSEIAGNAVRAGGDGATAGECEDSHKVRR